MNVINSTQDNKTSLWTIPVPVYTALITLSSILLVWSLVGNVLVIAVVYCNQNLRTNMNYLVVNMAVSDLLVPLVVMPSRISLDASNFKWLVDGPLGEALCKLVIFLSNTSPLVSSISLIIIAFHRFIAVVYPTRGQILSRKTRWFAISIPWIVAIALNVYLINVSNKHGSFCYTVWPDRTTAIIFYSMLSMVGFAIPLIVIIILYTMIIYKLSRSLDNVRDMIEVEMIRSRQKRNKRIFSMLITIVVLFIICWCPFTVFRVIIFAPHSPVWLMDIGILIFIILYEVFCSMWYLQAAINPCIYFVFLKDFRQGLKRLCCWTNGIVIEPIPRRPRTPGGDSNQEPTCTPPHINTTSL